MLELLCFGYGYVAQALAAPGPGVTTTTRDGRNGSLAYADGVLSDAVLRAIGKAHRILVSTPPHLGEPALVDAIARHGCNLKWLGYLSTTGVYGDYQGEWVTEESETRAVERRSVVRLESEAMWRALPQTHVFRLSGIYGPGRNAIEQLLAGTAHRIDAPGQVFSRIHVADIVQALKASMQALTPGETYNLADDEPCAQRAVVEYAAQLLGMDPPPLLPLAQAGLSAMGQSFYRANRRVNANKIKQTHGLTWIYPSYRDGLATILQDRGKSGA